MRLGAEDDCGCGSGDEDKPQGGERGSSTSGGSYEPVTRDS